MYILECADGSYYTGEYYRFRAKTATNISRVKELTTPEKVACAIGLLRRIWQNRWSFYREKQVQGWRQEKEKALMENSNDQKN